MSPFPKTKQPAGVAILESWIHDLARETNEDAARLRRNLGYMVVMAVLSRLRESDGTPLFVLKGGVAMHLRFPTRARLSLDQDVVFRREMRDLERVLAQASRHPIGRFRVEAIGKPEKIEKTPAYRQRIRVTYNGSDFATVHLEASPREGHSIDPDTLDRLDPSPDLSLFGFDSVGPIPAMSVPYQIAQKIHACTEIPSDGKPNKRQNDLLDLQLLEELIRPDGWPAVRRACVEVFAGRRKHAWPPRVVVPPEWPSDYARTASDFRFPVTDVAIAADNVRRLIVRIDEAVDRRSEKWLALKVSDGPQAKYHLLISESDTTLCGRAVPAVPLSAQRHIGDPEQKFGSRLCAVCDSAR